MCRIYVIRNTVNSKVYVGQTRKTLSNRFSNHVSAAKHGKDYVIGKAMRKYGIDKFYIELIEECDNCMANEREIYWIAYYNSTNNKYGYNMSSGGNRQDDQARPLDESSILQQFSDGKSAVKIAKDEHVEVTRITAILKKNNITYGQEKQRIDKDVEEKSIELYNLGYSTRTIGRYLGINHTTISKILKRYGIPARSSAETKNLERNLPTLSNSAP